MKYYTEKEYELINTKEYQLLSGIADFYHYFKNELLIEDKLLIYNFVKLIYRYKCIDIYYIDSIFNNNYVENFIGYPDYLCNIERFFKEGIGYCVLNDRLIMFKRQLIFRNSYDKDIYNSFYNTIINRYIKNDKKIDRFRGIFEGNRDVNFYLFLKEMHEKQS